MPDAKTICNLGLAKIGSTSINNLNPPKTVIEKLCVAGYNQWRDSELKKRRWVFATIVTTLAPTPASPIKNVEYPYQYHIPGDMLRPIRPAAPIACQWVIRGQFFYSRGNTLPIEYIRRVNETEMSDPLFIDVLAWRIAQELVEPTTQSNEKFQKAQIGYRDAVSEASAQNAFILEPQRVNGVDTDYEWIAERTGYVYG